MKAPLIAFLALVAMTQGAEGANEPVLRIEAEAQRSKHIDVSGSGRIALTASEDKTARLWELPSGRLLRILRPPIGPAAEGMLYCCALSPDGTIATVGGYTHYLSSKEFCLYVFDVLSGKLLRQLGKLATAPLSVAFSADGSSLACVTGGHGLIVWDARTWREIGRDRDYGNYQSHSVAWDAGKRIVTTCEDDFLRLYEIREGRLRLLVRRAPKARAFPCSARFSPDGSQIAVGFVRSPTIAVLSAKDLSIMTGVEADGPQNFVSWNHDGTALAAGGTWGPSPEIPSDLAKEKASIAIMLANVERLPNPKYTLRQWKWPQRSPYADTTIGFNELHDIRPLPDGGLLFAGDSWGTVSRTGRFSQPVTSPLADFRSFVRSRFYVSSNGNTVAFCFHPFGEPPVQFSLASRSFKPFKDDRTTDILHLAKTDGLKVENWQATTSLPTLDGHPIVFRGARSSSLAIAGNNSFFVLGAYLSLSCYSPRGDMLWELPTAGPAFNVNLTSDDKVVVASLGDGTIRWYRAVDGHELLALFPHSDRRRWVLWTPEGYYDCSPGGEDLIGWHINRGSTEAGDFFWLLVFVKFSIAPMLLIKF
jgi:WD40 repeat protein